MKFQLQTMSLKSILFVVLTAFIAFTSIQCAKNEQKRTKDRTSNAINDAFDATTGILKNVVNAIDNAVYKK